MIIGIDARPLIEKKTGFGYYLHNLLVHILEKDSVNQYILFSDRKIYFEHEAYDNVRVVEYEDGLLVKKSFYFYYCLWKYMKNNNIVCDLFWGTIHILPKGLGENTKLLLTMHDFTHIFFPRSTTLFNLIVSKIMIGSSVNRADGVVCISKSTERDLKKIYVKKIRNQVIHTIYESGNSRHTSLEEKTSKEVENLVPMSYVLFVGTIEPRKNIDVLLEAASALEPYLKVVVCGKIGWAKRRTIRSLHSTHNVVFLNYINNKEKEILMKNAFCQVQPSLYEGFGLPVVEAMQEGNVVVVANNSSLSELVEIDSLRFETKSSDDLAKKILALYEDKELYTEAKKYCSHRGLDFSWEQAAEEYIAFFNELISQS